MRPTLEDGLRALEEATELAKSIRIELDEEYLHWIATVEALPENASGGEKSWVWRLIDRSKKHFARATVEYQIELK